MFSAVKKHPIISLAIVAGAGWWFFIRPKTAGASGQGTPSASQTLVPIAPGNQPAAVQAGGELLLQLPTGASWDQQNPVVQDGGIKGVVMPLTPFGAEEQIWRGVTGTGTITARWLDENGNEQSSSISVTAKGES
jgi:hypothetical protein